MKFNRLLTQVRLIIISSGNNLARLPDSNPAPCGVPKFSLQIREQAPPEWEPYFLDYKILKKAVNAIKHEAVSLACPRQDESLGSAPDGKSSSARGPRVAVNALPVAGGEASSFVGRAPVPAVSPATGAASSFAAASAGVQEQKPVKSHRQKGQQGGASVVAPPPSFPYAMPAPTKFATTTTMRATWPHTADGAADRAFFALLGQELRKASYFFNVLEFAAATAFRDVKRGERGLYAILRQVVLWCAEGTYTTHAHPRRLTTDNAAANAAAASAAAAAAAQTSWR